MIFEHTNTDKTTGGKGTLQEQFMANASEEQMRQS